MLLELQNTLMVILLMYLYISKTKLIVAEFANEVRL